MYTDRTTIERRLGTTLSLTDTEVNRYISEAEAWVDSVTQTTFEASGSTSRIYSTRYLSNMVVIDQAVSVSKVETLKSRTQNGDTWYTLDSTAYRLKPENKTPKRRVEFVDSLGIGFPIYFEGTDASVRVTGVFGYSSTVPTDIQRITTSYVIELMRLDGVAPQRVESEKLGDASFSYNVGKNQDIISRLEKQLMKYRDYGDVRW